MPTHSRQLFHSGLTSEQLDICSICLPVQSSLNPQGSLPCLPQKKRISPGATEGPLTNCHARSFQTQSRDSPPQEDQALLTQQAGSKAFTAGD
ncbi:E3 Ubiquitin-Protein Ligase Rnf6 [Manis pentadactyla]|nr:E3 Ubiquitin-Protein Ligase Rnf6 [Manis pentadactyla]